MNQRNDQILTARDAFKRDRYVVIKGFLPPLVTRIAYRYAIMRLMSGQLEAKDASMPGTPSAYADTLIETLMETWLPYVSQVSNVELFPTYSHFRVYRKGDQLKPHSDRPACEISVSICLGYHNGNLDDPDYKWPIYMDGSLDYRNNPEKACASPQDNEGTAALLSPGDAVVYRGCEVKHWREAFPGDHHAQVFIHYVDKHGPYAKNRFDMRPALGMGPETIRDRSPQPYFPDNETETRCPCGSGHPAADCCERPELLGLVTPIDPALGPVTLPPGLLILEDYIDAATADRLVQYADRTAGTPARVGDPGKDGGIDNSLHEGFIADRIEVTHDKEIQQMCLDIWSEVYRTQIGDALNVEMEWFEIPHLLRYGPGGVYKLHSDSENWDSGTQRWVKGIDRDYSGIIYLNDEFRGGSLSFPNYNLRIRPRTGMLVCFPSDHNFSHYAEEVESGIRYAMVTWGAARGSARVPGGRPNWPNML